MTELIDLAYTTAGGIVGAAVTTYLSRNHERRHQRAEVQQRLQRVAAVRAGVHDLAPGKGRRARYTAGRRPAVPASLGLSVLLDDGTDAERALREALDGLVVSALSAGVPRRVLDFAGGGEKQAFQGEVLRLVDSCLGGVLDEADLDALSAACDDYREATTQLLLQALWHPWRSRLRRRARLRALRARAAELGRRQQAALEVLAAPEHALALGQALALEPRQA
ncbi:hypothetical protein [Nonomuraea gerenzanensis]|uniref:Uncharacterized protein n=1 Tax=Nonomuraea gerenzanensis TaxID=93944 RepID=A0A1M4E9T9_9ACTN|nr:hypothetical protein [Nonomuraea gerenzanensis]UBU17879.1 hypothetical protein LCN96_23505 [Nonomuraea gerenzanensis]SBO95671.1 hypothetical protein BN4615_P5187 [Nonomuraea gerenzanensis]